MPSTTTTTVWYCCSCKFGPMTTALTPTCVNCLKHSQCTNCDAGNTRVRSNR
ncbi:hypothetical protein F5Y05DRAFT_376562 [Hypoxylon sp. FL0543]|nr:hypothetical protein F5Y05DRAFT_376562 [Hypoxylon sp. FL0543]